MYKIKDSYVLGFAFATNLDHVLLIRKNRPAWQAGKLNGIGGKIEKSETPINAMIREFDEETGINVGYWSYVGYRYREPRFDLSAFSYEMYMYATCLPIEVMHRACQYPTDEKVICSPLNLDIIRQDGVPGLAWTVDVALCSLIEGFTIKVQDTDIPNEAK